MALMVALNDEVFDSTVLRDGIVLIECSAPWCNGCREFAPVFREAAERHPAHTFATVDTQAEVELTRRLGVRHVPSLVLFRDGILLYRHPGYVPAEALDELLATAERLDMEVVRAELNPGTSSAA